MRTKILIHTEIELFDRISFSEGGRVITNANWEINIITFCDLVL